MQRFILFILFFLFFFTQLYLVYQPALDFDEGAYTTAFMLIQKGHAAYQQTFLAQPPGFLLSVYPGFIIFGSTLAAARITILLWTIVGLFAVVWLCTELHKPAMSFLVIGLMLLVPVISSHFFIFQSDMLVNVFSLLCLAAFFRFYNVQKRKWLFFSAICLGLSLWTKYSVYLFAPILCCFFYLPRKTVVKNLFLYSACLLFVSFLIVVPFSLSGIIHQTIGLRLLAFTSGGKTFIRYILEYPIVTFSLLGSVILFAKNKKKFLFPLLPLSVWVGTIFGIYFFYHPLFEHHLPIAFIPLLLVFSYLIWDAVSTHPLFLKKLSIAIFAVGSLIYSLSLQNRQPIGLANVREAKLVQSIDANSKPPDTILTDDEMLYSLSNRLPLPQLSDTSTVRIQADNISSKSLETLIKNNPPKIILPETGRLTKITNFQTILLKYKKITEDGVTYYVLQSVH